MHTHAERGHDQHLHRVVCPVKSRGHTVIAETASAGKASESHRWIESARTGLFPAKAGPTKKQRVQSLRLAAHSVGPASAGKLLPLLLIFYEASPGDDNRDLGAG